MTAQSVATLKCVIAMQWRLVHRQRSPQLYSDACFHVARWYVRELLINTSGGAPSTSGISVFVLGLGVLVGTDESTVQRVSSTCW